MLWQQTDFGPEGRSVAEPSNVGSSANGGVGQKKRKKGEEVDSAAHRQLRFRRKKFFFAFESQVALLGEAGAGLEKWPRCS